MFMDDYENNYNSGQSNPPRDDGYSQDDRVLEPDAVYDAQPRGGDESGQFYAAAPGNAGAQPSGGRRGKGAKKKGVAVFACLLAAVVLIAGVLIAIMNSGDDTHGDGGANTGVTGDATLNLSDTPTLDTISSSSGALSAQEIYNKVQASNVGIVVYSQSSSSASGEGSGIVMGEDSNGTHTYIITCAHVISGSGIKAVVQLHDGTQYDAEIVGYDVRTDIGVLRIQATGLTAAEFGDSSKLNVGETVYALGNPGGMEFFGSFTSGMVSAISRPVSSEIGYSMECIQHTAAISPGNSGGALINQYGQIVGINSLKITNSDYELMGFAIPISSAKEIIDDLIAYGRVPNRPKLGISYYANSSSQQYNMIVQIKGLPAGSLIIAEINSDSDLVNSDARVGDLIVAVDGKDLTTADVLLEAIDNSKVGDSLTLTLCRISSNYQVSEFKVDVKLVEDTGNTSSSTQSESPDQFVNPFGN